MSVFAAFIAAVMLGCCNAESIHDLVICRLSRQSGYAAGGDEVFLLCEKINKGLLLSSFQLWMLMHFNQGH